MQLTLRGTPILYYGEEIGMETHQPERKEDVKDPLGVSGWPQQKGRDGERRPMQWSAAENAGFTRGTPWLPVDAGYKTHNAAVEDRDPQSILSFYRSLLALRHTSFALLDGDYLPLDESNAQVLAYARKSAKESIVVVLNFSAAPQSFAPDWKALGADAAKTEVLLSTVEGTSSIKDGKIQLSPFSVCIARLHK
jgi:alpha-glucosidase